MSEHLRQQWRQRVEAAGGNVYYRMHRWPTFSAEEAITQEFKNVNFVRTRVGPIKKGYSCFDNPWHLWDYIMRRRWHFADVVAFTGRKSSQRGADGEPLVTPTAEPIWRKTWDDFTEWVQTQPMGDPPTYGGSGGGYYGNHWGDKEAYFESMMKAFGQDFHDPKSRVKSFASRRQAEYDYRGLHQPSSDGPPANDLLDKSGEWSLPEDIYEHPEWYTGFTEANFIGETMRALRAVRGKPGAAVTIYRAAPAGLSTINHGDWVSLSLAYARGHAMDAYDEAKDWPVYSAQVPAHTVRHAGDDLMEWGYWGPDISARVS